MIRLFGLGLWVAVEFLLIWATQFNRTFRSPYKSHTPQHRVYSQNGYITHITPHEEDEFGLLGPEKEKEKHHHSRRTTHESYAVLGGEGEEMTTKHKHDPESETHTVQIKHWYMVYYTNIQQNRTWLPAAKYLPFVWFVMYGVMYAGMFYFWYRNYDLPDFPQVESWSNYDTTFLLMILSRFFTGAWTIMFWGSGGDKWYLRLAFLDILFVFGLGIAILYFLYGVNWVSFGLFVPFVLWSLIILYYTGVFLSAAYSMKHLIRRY